MTKDEAENIAHELLRVGLDEKANQYPSQISGQKQRVAIVRSLPDLK